MENKALDMHKFAQELLEKYDDLQSTIQKGIDITDEDIDGFIGSEETMGETLDALILLKKIHAGRRKIAEKEEAKCMIFIKRIMKRLRIEKWKCEDGSASGKIVDRWEYKDKENYEGLSQEFYGPDRYAVDRAIKAGETPEGVQIVDRYLQVTIR